MTGLISETMLCSSCGHSAGELLDRDKRNDTYECPDCHEMEYRRTWSVPQVRTEKTSKTIPEVVAKGRFDDLRRKQELKKEKAGARASGDAVSEKKINKEIKKL